MKITSIQQQKKDPLRVNIFLDDKFAFGIDSKLLVDFNLYKGVELTQEEIRKIIRKDTGTKLKGKVLKLIAARPRSIRETSDYIHKKLCEGKYDIEEEYWDELASGVIEELCEFKILDDLAFSKWFVENRFNFKPRGKSLLKSELMQKGIASDIIAQTLESLDQDSELRLARKLADKKIRTLSRFEEKMQRKKLSAFLQRKGFSWDIIRKVID